MPKASRDRVEKYRKAVDSDDEDEDSDDDMSLLPLRRLGSSETATGDFNRWITRFEDQMETCETIGVDFSEEAKILYFMSNLNDSIFGDVKSNFMDLSTRALFPQNYEELKQRMIAEYSPLMTMKPHVVMKIIRGEDTRRFGVASFKAELDPLSKS